MKIPVILKPIKSLLLPSLCGSCLIVNNYINPYGLADKKPASCRYHCSSDSIWVTLLTHASLRGGLGSPSTTQSLRPSQITPQSERKPQDRVSPTCRPALQACARSQQLANRSQEGTSFPSRAGSLGQQCRAKKVAKGRGVCRADRGSLGPGQSGSS